MLDVPCVTVSGKQDKIINYMPKLFRAHHLLQTTVGGGDDVQKPIYSSLAHQHVMFWMLVRNIGC